MSLGTGLPPAARGRVWVSVLHKSKRGHLERRKKCGTLIFSSRGSKELIVGNKFQKAVGDNKLYPLELLEEKCHLIIIHIKVH